MGLISSVTGAHAIDRPGGIFVRLVDQISPEDRILFQTVARVILSDSRGTLVEQVNRRDLMAVRVPLLAPAGNVQAAGALRSGGAAPALAKRDLILSNGTGGFTPDGREYVIGTAAGQATPAPWGNVMANPQFGRSE